jgi:hypothetical protein
LVASARERETLEGGDRLVLRLGSLGELLVEQEFAVGFHVAWSTRRRRSSRDGDDESVRSFGSRSTRSPAVVDNSLAR